MEASPPRGHEGANLSMPPAGSGHSSRSPLVLPSVQAADNKTKIGSSKTGFIQQPESGEGKLMLQGHPLLKGRKVGGF